VRYHTLLTHEHPDLDSLVGCWLLARHGEPAFPGISAARMRFLPASFELEGKSAAEQEEEGAVAVDIGGGRFDNHLRGKLRGDENDLEECATSLVAAELGLLDAPAMALLVEFVRLQDTQGRSLSSRRAADHAFALVAVLRGLNHTNGDDFERTATELWLLLDAVAVVTEPATEVLEWYRQHRPFELELGGRTHRTANLFDATVALWLARRLERPIPVPVSDEDLRREGSASRTIARSWGLVDRPEYGKLLDFAPREWALAPGGYLSDVDFSVSILNVVFGAYRLAEGDLDQVVDRIGILFDAVMAMERDWFDALDSFEKCSRIVRAGRGRNAVRICAFESSSPSMNRVARYRARPDLCIHHDPSIGAIGITLVQRGSRLEGYTFDGRGTHPDGGGVEGVPRLDSLAARVRLAEAIEGDLPFDPAHANDVGQVCGWFLHQSLRIFAKGSRKARDVPRTRIPFDDLVELIATTFDPDRKLPDRWCPSSGCPAGGCRFAELDLPNCRGRRD
jgi:hypothetical protein